MKLFDFVPNDGIAYFVMADNKESAMQYIIDSIEKHIENNEKYPDHWSEEIIRFYTEIKKIWVVAQQENKLPDGYSLFERTFGEVTEYLVSCDDIDA